MHARDIGAVLEVVPAETVIETIGIALLSFVLLSAIVSVLLGVGLWYLEAYSD